jgi:hypothetical protein
MLSRVPKHQALAISRLLGQLVVESVRQLSRVSNRSSNLCTSACRGAAHEISMSVIEDYIKAGISVGGVVRFGVELMGGGYVVF